MNRSALSPLQWSQLTDRIAVYSGVALDSSRLRSLESALAVRMEATGQERVESYLRALAPAELHALVELLVNHETQFFRTPAHYRALHEQILPELHRARPAGLALRGWSAGCATGEEAYSLAITALKTLPPSRPAEIHATDLSSAALGRARAGRYRGRSLQNVASADLNKYFQPQDDAYEVQRDVMSIVFFEQHNLQDVPPPWGRALDLIFCQNVTIYFSLETCRSLMARFFDALQPGGYLFLGYSETLWRIFDRFETVEVAGAFVYRKPVARTMLAAPVGTPQRPAPATRPRTRPAAPRLQPATRQDAAEGALRTGRVLLADGKHAEALEALRRVPPDQPLYAKSLGLIAQVHANRGDWELAAAEARRAIELDVLTGEAHYLLGVIYARQEQWTPALDHLLRAQYLDPAAPLPSFHLADVYRSQGRLDLAEREYQVTLRKLDVLSANLLLDGVSVAWLRETCARYLQQLRSAVRRR